jgi:hypothetical protein
MRIHGLLMGTAVCALTGLAQDVTSTSTVSTRGVAQGSMGFAGSGFMGSPVTGAPYSAQRVSEHVQVAADGTRFTQNNRQETIYRDSQGRLRTERSMMMGPNAPADVPMVIEIQDPVAGFSYTLDAQNKVAHRVVLQTPEMRRQAPTGIGGGGGARVGGGVAAGVGGGVETSNTRAGVLTGMIPAPAAGAVTSRSRPEMQQEDLGTQVIEGVVAQGHRSTMAWAAGTQGNDRPFQVVNENWFSPDLKEMVLSKTIDPRSGESTTKLINISRNEPSADLFIPPAGYQVVDETGPFQIHWTSQRQ